MQRVLVIYNPNSSQYVHVKDEVLARLTELKGCAVGKFEIQKISFDENVKRLKRLLRDGDFVISAGGDATAAVAANAITQSGKDAMLAVLPYGNFNDLARTLGTTCFDEVFSDSLAKTISTSSLYPLEIWVDGKLWRYATCYVTMGMTAEAVELFDDKKIRKELKKGRKSSWRSYVYLAKWYFKNRHRKEFLPEFKLNGELMKKGTSDYAAVNGRSMCRVMKGGEDFLKPGVFRSKVDRLVSFPRLFDLMAKSILVRVPGEETRGDVIEFVEPATVELQAEGEYQVFKNVKTIEIKKSEKPLKVLRRKNG